MWFGMDSVHRYSLITEINANQISVTNKRSKTQQQIRSMRKGDCESDFCCCCYCCYVRMYVFFVPFCSVNKHCFLYENWTNKRIMVVNSATGLMNTLTGVFCFQHNWMLLKWVDGKKTHIHANDNDDEKIKIFVVISALKMIIDVAIRH